jgi:hypothetical protein
MAFGTFPEKRVRKKESSGRSEDKKIKGKMRADRQAIDRLRAPHKCPTEPPVDPLRGVGAKFIFANMNTLSRLVLLAAAAASFEACTSEEVVTTPPPTTPTTTVRRTTTVSEPVPVPESTTTTVVTPAQ